MTDQWTDRLSEYLDGQLAPGERVTLEAHLTSCATCAATLDELRRVVARAGALEDRPPSVDLWPEIAARIGSGGRRAVRARRLSFTVPQLLAASVALVLVGGGAVFTTLRERSRVAAPTPTPDTVVIPVSTAWASYATAVADLEQVLARNRSRLDTSTVRVLEESLARIDRAIADAQRALAADPANSYLNRHLADNMRRKVDLLRRANALASAAS